MAIINPLHVVQSATRTLVLERGETSYFWDQVLSAVQKVHFVWKLFEKATTYGNPDNFIQLAAGHSVNWLAGDNFFVKLAAGSVLIATRIAECAREELLLLQEIKKLSETAFDNTELYQRSRWLKPGESQFLSAAITNSIRSFFNAFFRILSKIFRHLIDILKRLFTLSMRMMSAAEAFSLSPQALKEGTEEFFVNLEKCYEALIDDKELLLGFLEENKGVIEMVFELSGASPTYREMVSKVEEAASASRRLIGRRSALKDVSRFAFQHMMFGLFQSVNMHRYMPLEWIPPKEPEWMVENHRHPRYPPNDWIQIYNYERNARDWLSNEGTKHHAGTSLFFDQL
ncbi:hypothetical protein ELAC_0277 [Estrella lausannensis]|uniref:Uncharacterized protein n=1 Tax=Estrella lausannensis TaxID=483423 RepID=A0A0H5DP22_9BACT|nr:hypothetical protein ELAC_0277 [Estrella lausannensis]